MSQPVNLADDVYESLTRLKRKKKASYSEVIRELLPKWHAQGDMSLKELAERIRSRHKGLKARAKPLDHDLIAYGVSRAHSR
ncbi:MAG: antitoxin VapB family protein [Candidatus Micrarchaeota archaeon]